MNEEYIKKLEEENQKLQETNALYQARYGDIRETLEKETKVVTINTSEDFVTTFGGSVNMSQVNGNTLTANSIGVSSGYVIRQDTDALSGMVWRPQDDTKTILQKLNELKCTIHKQQRPHFKRWIHCSLRKIKRKFL
jgi:hypothetical protein